LFKYEKERNEIIQIDETSFSNENLTEPQNIEIWIRKNPSILSEVEGEELIIIGEQQASETKKRLDLLGVDKFGNIVIIGNYSARTKFRPKYSVFSVNTKY